jgi:RNA polymerase sigma factor (sigma-70 family)
VQRRGEPSKLQKIGAIWDDRAVGGVLELGLSDSSLAADELVVVSPDELSRIWHKHAARLLLIARAIGEPAEDAVQEAFIRLAQQVALPDEPLAWLVRVVRNQLIQWHRSGVRRNHRNERAATERGWFTTVDHADSLDAGELTLALQRLPDVQREIVVLHLWGEMSFEQIAETVALSRSTAHRRYLEAIQTLRTCFDCPQQDGRS